MLQELNLQEMNEIKGKGVVTVEAYCATLWNLYANNQDTWSNQEIASFDWAWVNYCIP